MDMKISAIKRDTLKRKLELKQEIKKKTKSNKKFSGMPHQQNESLEDRILGL